MADLIRKRQISATEAVAAAIVRLDARDPALNAVVNRLDTQARRAART